MRKERLLILVPAIFLVLPAGCDLMHRDKPVDPAIEQSCREEGFDPDTTEFDDCVKELSQPN
jgi:hypothetical protein